MADQTQLDLFYLLITCKMKGPGDLITTGTVEEPKAYKKHVLRISG
jgi:hypothetical protein